MSARLVIVASVCALSQVSASCTPVGDPAIGASGFSDNFDRTELGTAWNNTGGPYEIIGGELHVRGARNKPLWLKRRLPPNVRVSLDVRSMTPDGDIKFELFGDGVSRATTESYTATGYVLILGGWGNQLNVIARMNEHGDDRVVGPRRPVQEGRTYHVVVERRGGMLTVSVDGAELMRMNDTAPLSGNGHDHFGFNNWQSDLWFDNLQITPLS